MAAEVRDRFGTVIEIGDFIRAWPPIHRGNILQVLEIRERPTNSSGDVVDAEVVVGPIDSRETWARYSEKSERATLVANWTQVVGQSREKLQAANKLARRAICTLIDRRNNEKELYNQANRGEVPMQLRKIGTCPNCLEEQIYYADIGLCAGSEGSSGHQHGVCWSCIRQMQLYGNNGRGDNRCPVCRKETKEWERCTLTPLEESELQLENPVYVEKIILGENITLPCGIEEPMPVPEADGRQLLPLCTHTENPYCVGRC
ncbi:hypothetical protein N9E76_00775 [bacterium]|nr:hypothetical protein [bacterium]